ncbi:MAG: membrane dipeptidase [Lentisphaerae bacterium]|nr:membrane dipeptidase [Lentisphaerota bacterium]
MINDKIRMDREIAMEILKPSPRDLEHGLALHADALVIEAYGLGLRAPVDVVAFNAAVDSGASAQELVDMAVDTSFVNWARDPQLRQEYMEAWHASGVTCTFQNAGQESNHPLLLMRRLARHTWLTDAMPDFLRRATTPEDIVAAHAAGRRCVCLTCNGVPLTRADISVDEELRHLPLFAMLGARMMHLTYNRANPIAGGCGEPHDGGLTDFGHAVVAEMNRLGIMVDLAHTGLRSCLDVARASSRPVVVSHSTAHAMNPHIRAKTDEVIQAVVDTGGVMGITNVPAAVDAVSPG